MAETGSMDGAQADAMRLLVMDEEDLAVVSAHLQDAEVTLDEVAFLPRQRRFALVVARFDWPLAATGSFARCRTGLHFDGVEHVARAGLPAGPKDQPLRLLAMAFVPGEAPAGQVLLTFMGGGQIRLTVECLQAEMRDIGPRWAVPSRPPALPPEGLLQGAPDRSKASADKPAGNAA